jgi:hypothetical protein
MVATRAQKRSAADSSNPLHQAGILHRVLSYVGPGYWLFISEVSSLWRELYVKLANLSVDTVWFRAFCKSKRTCTAHMTLYSSVFASPSRVRHAYDCGLDCTSEPCQFAAGRSADVTTLAAAHELGMAYTKRCTTGTAWHNRLTVLQYLRAAGCPWSTDLPDAAARSGGVEVLRWACENGCPWSVHWVPCSA